MQRKQQQQTDHRCTEQLKQCVILKSKQDSYRLQGSCIKGKMNKKANFLSVNPCCVSSGDSNSRTSCRGRMASGRGRMESGRGRMESGGV